LFLVLPESPLWIASKGDVMSAVTNLRVFYPQSSFKMDELEYWQRQQQENSLKSDVASEILYSYRQSPNQKSTVELFSKLFSHKYYRRTLLISILNFTLSFATYGISLWMPTIFAKMEDSPSSSFCDSVSNSEITGPDCQKGNKEQYIDSIYFALIQLPGNVATITILDWIGPKPILIISLLTSSITTLCLAYSTSAWESFMISCFYSLVSVFSWNSLNVLNSFLFPVEIRSTATGLMSGANRVGGLLGALCTGLLLESGCGLTMFFIASISALGFFTITKLHIPRNF
jgi:VNT family MFS transporter (synaptic vesicle glycoprotein 2)